MVGVVCVCRVLRVCGFWLPFSSAVCVCRIVSCVVFVVAYGMWLMLGAYGDQAMGWMRREQRQWRVR